MESKRAVAVFVLHADFFSETAEVKDAAVAALILDERRFVDIVSEADFVGVGECNDRWC